MEKYNASILYKIKFINRESKNIDFRKLTPECCSIACLNENDTNLIKQNLSSIYGVMFSYKITNCNLFNATYLIKLLKDKIPQIVEKITMCALIQIINCNFRDEFTIYIGSDRCYYIGTNIAQRATYNTSIRYNNFAMYINSDHEIVYLIRVPKTSKIAITDLIDLLYWNNKLKLSDVENVSVVKVISLDEYKKLKDRINHFIIKFTEKECEDFLSSDVADIQNCSNTDKKEDYSYCCGDCDNTMCTNNKEFKDNNSDTELQDGSINIRERMFSLIFEKTVESLLSSKNEFIESTELLDEMSMIDDFTIDISIKSDGAVHYSINAVSKDQEDK